MNKTTIKKVVRNHSVLLSRIYNWFCFNKKIIKGSGNVIKKDGAFLNHCRIRIIGDNNTLLLNYRGGDDFYSRLYNCHFNIIGSNNVIEIGTCSILLDVTFTMYNNNNEIRVGRDFDCHSQTELAALEGTKIIIGNDALFSANIKFRTGDSHSVLDCQTGVRTNHSKDIVLGDHVWVGNSVIVLKGANIGDHSIVAIGSVVPGKTYPANSVIGGNPAKVIKSNVDWRH